MFKLPENAKVEKKVENVRVNRLTIGGKDEDCVPSILISDEVATEVYKLILSYQNAEKEEDREQVSSEWTNLSWGSKTARKIVEKIESTDGVFECRPVDTDFGTMYQIRIVPQAKGTTLESQYASIMTKRIKDLSGIVEFIYTAKNGKTYKGRGFRDAETAKEMVDHLNNNINL